MSGIKRYFFLIFCTHSPHVNFASLTESALIAIKLKSSCCFYDSKNYNFPSCVVLAGGNITKHQSLGFWLLFMNALIQNNQLFFFSFTQSTLGNIFYLFGILMFWISGTAYTPHYEVNC